MTHYDLHVHTSLSIGENSVEDVAKMAKRLELSGIGIVRYYPVTENLPKIEGIDLISSIMLKAAKPDELNAMAEKARSKILLLMCCATLNLAGKIADLTTFVCVQPMTIT